MHKDQVKLAFSEVQLEVTDVEVSHLLITNNFYNLVIAISHQ